MRTACLLVGLLIVPIAALAVAENAERPSSAADARSLPSAPAVPEASVDRSPVDLALGADGTWLITANQTSNTASLVSLTENRVLDEVAVGQRPVAVTLLADGKRALVTGSRSSDLTLLDVAEGKLTVAGRIPVGVDPHGVVATADGRTAYVALAAVDEVAVVDLPQRRVAQRIAVGRWPRYLALSPDEKTLTVGSSGDRAVSFVDTAKREMVRLEKFRGFNIGQMQVSRDGQHVYTVWSVTAGNPVNAGSIRQGWVVANRLGRLSLTDDSDRHSVSLDPSGRAVGDPHGIAVTGDERRVLLTCAGSHELLVFTLAELPLVGIGGSDHMDPALVHDRRNFRRIELGGRPMSVRVSTDDRTAIVANYLENCVQVIDLEKLELARTIDLGGPAEPSLARRGEAIFYDARRSLDQWYSCHSCHYEGGTNSETFDTLNDGTRITYKTVLPLWNVTKTGPWTWHGWQTSLEDAMHRSMTTTMVGRRPSKEDVSALLGFLGTLTPPPSANRGEDGSLTPAAERGAKIFASAKAGCATCHSGPLLSDGKIHDVGLAGRSDKYEGFNTPSLLGVGQKTLLLHDGRARTLDRVLSGPHAPEKVAGEEPLDEGQRADLIEYLRSL